jgi:hypothetical protein
MKRLKASRRELSCRADVSSSHGMTWSGSASGLAPFNPQAAAVGRDQTGLSCLFGLFRSFGWLIG